MKQPFMLLLLLFIISLTSIYTYDRAAARAYAEQYWNSLNHDCNSAYYECTPYSYWGSEHCGYEGQGGDCANFVSQCILAGGHPHLVGGDCRGEPCGIEEIGALRLALCLGNNFGWKRYCGYLMPPPAGTKAGDVIIYHETSCEDWSAHAVIVVEGGADAKIACHSNMRYGAHYTYIADSKPYFEWVLYPDGDEPEPEPEPTPTPTANEKMVKVITTAGVNRRDGPGTNYAIVGFYEYGSLVSVVEQSGEWYKDVDGYYITTNASWVTDLYGIVTPEIGLNVRDSPNASAKIVGLLDKGTKVQCIKSSAGWFYIISGDVKGWAHGDYLSL
jgi:uncharacterized protein YraI